MEYPQYRYQTDSQWCSFTEFIKIISPTEVLSVKWGITDMVGYGHHIPEDIMEKILKYPVLAGDDLEQSFRGKYEEVSNKIKEKLGLG